MSSFDALQILLFFPTSCASLLVGSHEGREDAVLLVQQGLGGVVLQDDPPLHHNHQVGVQDGVHTMLRGGEGGRNPSLLRAARKKWKFKMTLFFFKKAEYLC